VMQLDAGLQGVPDERLGIRRGRDAGGLPSPGQPVPGVPPIATDRGGLLNDRGVRAGCGAPLSGMNPASLEKLGCVTPSRLSTFWPLSNTTRNEKRMGSSSPARSRR